MYTPPGTPLLQRARSSPLANLHEDEEEMKDLNLKKRKSSPSRRCMTFAASSSDSQRRSSVRIAASPADEDDDDEAGSQRRRRLSTTSIGSVCSDIDISEMTSSLGKVESWVMKMNRLKHEHSSFREDDVREVFRFMDSDGNGYITVAEMRLFLQAVLQGDDVKDETIASLLEEGVGLSPMLGARPPPSEKGGPPELNLGPSVLSASAHPDVQLSFEDFREMILTAPSAMWRKIVSKQMIRVLTDTAQDDYEQHGIANLEEQTARRLQYSVSERQWQEDRVRIKIDDKCPFARGSMRECYRFKKMSSHLLPSDVRLGKSHTLWSHQPNYVAKRYIREFDELNTMEVILSDVVQQNLCKRFAEYFNATRPPKYVDFLNAFVLQLEDDGRVFFCESFVSGTYKKYNSNAGFVARESSTVGDNDDDPPIASVNEAKKGIDREKEGAKRRRHIVRFTPQCFSHYTFQKSAGKLIVTDIQGVQDLYTDPQIHTCDAAADSDALPEELKLRRSLPNGNLGSAGIGLFVRTHTCNALCRRLKLRPFDLTTSEKQMRAQRCVVTTTSTEAAISFVAAAPDNEKNTSYVAYDGDANDLVSLVRTFAPDLLVRNAAPAASLEDAYDIHASVAASYAYDVQQRPDSWRDVLSDPNFALHVARAAATGRHPRWRTVLAIMLSVRLKKAASTIDPSLLVPVPPRGSAAEEWTSKTLRLRFYIYFSELPSTLKMRHAMQSHGFYDARFWAYMLTEMRGFAKERSGAKLSEHPRYEAACKWAGVTCARPSTELTRVGDGGARGRTVRVAAIGVVALSVFMIATYRGLSRRR